jgi:glutathione synthase/RimK-type ligase-like ATP-grasp enzyme
MTTQPRLTRALAAVEARLLAEPQAIALRFERAGLLAALGQTEGAKQAYFEILRLDPTHFGVLNNFGTLLYETGYCAAARTVYTQAVACHPDQPLAHVNLANLELYKDDLAAARQHYETALRLDPDNAAAHQGLSAVFLETGDEAAMLRHRELGFRGHPMKTLPYRGDAEPVPLLLLVSSMRGDIPWRRLIDDHVFRVTTLAPSFYSPVLKLPPHRLIFNVIGDTDSCRADLEAAQELLRHTTAPVINPPASVLATGRMANAERLRALPGVVTPRIALLPRATLAGAGAMEALARHGLGFPLLLRRPGFHTGKHFVQVADPDALESAVAAMPGDELMAIAYLDSYGGDGCARKYRVMMIDGQLYPLHLAISRHWKVHYFTAAMADQPAHQAEEAAFLSNMPQVLGDTAMAALHAIQATLGLDFGGIDFGLDAAGNLLLFEANPTMLLNPPDADAQWDYRRGAADAALLAARRMLSNRVDTRKVRALP